MATDLNPIPGYNKDGEDSVWAFRNSQSGVKQLVAGSGITLSPASGLGAVTVTASGAVASVTADPAGVGLTTIPTTGAVVVKNTQPASTWASYAATGIVNMAGNEIQSADLIQTNYIAPGGLGFLFVSGRVFMNNNLIDGVTTLTTSGVINVGPSASIYPYSTGSPATRNYLDITAPVAIGANKGALRLVGNTATVLTIADTNDLTNIDTLNGHNLYAYGTFQVTYGSTTTLAHSTSTLIPFSVNIVGSGVSLAVAANGSFSMTKSGAYRIIMSLTITNSSVTRGVNVYLATVSDVTIASTIRNYEIQSGQTTLVYTATLPAYTANVVIEPRIFVQSGVTDLLLQTNYVPADINIELMG